VISDFFTLLFLIALWLKPRRHRWGNG